MSITAMRTTLAPSTVPILSQVHPTSHAESAQLPAQLLKVAFTSASLMRNVTNVRPQAGLMTRATEGVWQSLWSVKRDAELDTILAAGHALAENATSLVAVHKAAATPAQPSPQLKHKKYTWGMALLMLGGRCAPANTYGVCTRASVPDKLTDFAIKSGGELIRRPRALNFRYQVERDINTAFDRAALPEKDREPVVGAVLEAYGQTALSKKNKIRAEAERLIALDMILLELSHSTGTNRDSFQKLGYEIRNALKLIENYSLVTQYLREAPPHFQVRYQFYGAEKILDEYIDVTEKYKVKYNDLFSANSTSLDNLIIDICEKRFGREVRSFGIPPLEQKHNVEFVKKYVILIFRPFLTHSFTTKELFLGMHKRYALQETFVDIEFPPNTNQFVTALLNASPDITDYLAQELMSMYHGFRRNVSFERVFKESVNYRTAGIILNHLDLFQEDKIPRSIQLFLRGQMLPQMVTIKGEILPSLLAFTDPIDTHIVIISLTHSELKIFAKNSNEESLETFIRAHLSLFNKQRVDASALNISVMCDAGSTRDYLSGMLCLEPHLGHGYYQDYQQKLYNAILYTIKENIDSITYTDAEYKRENYYVTLQSLLFKLDVMLSVVTLALRNPLGSAICVTLGIGTGVSNFIINTRMANITDNGALYENALFEAKIGAWFTAFGAVLDIGIGAKAIRHSFKSYNAKRILGIGKTSLTSPHASMELKDMVKPRMYDKSVLGNRLSPPDVKGLQWGMHNTSYLKINDNYVKVVKGESEDIYYIGKNKIATRFTSDGEFLPLHSEKKNTIGGIY